MPDPTTATRLPLIVDTDGGVDDLAAIWLLASDPAVHLHGVVATGISRPAAVVARNVRMMLQLVDASEVPVVLGRDEPSGPAPRIAAAPHHGPEGLGPVAAWDVPASAAVGFDELVGDAGDHQILTLGPLSTVAALLGSGHLERTRRIVIMGGAIGVVGNALPQAEANIARDPTAAARVLAHPWPEVRLVPLDSTAAATLTDVEIGAIERLPRVGPVLGPMLRHYASYAGSLQGFPCHDLFAAAAVAHPEFAPWQTMRLQVDVGESAAWGMTVADRRSRRSNVDPAEWPDVVVAVAADSRAFREYIGRVAMQSPAAGADVRPAQPAPSRCPPLTPHL